MDDIIEFIIEMFFDIGGEVATNKKISKWVRYPVSIILILFVTIIIGGLLVLGISAIKENIVAALILIGISLLLLVGIVYEFRKVYKKKNVEVEKWVKQRKVVLLYLCIL